MSRPAHSLSLAAPRVLRLLRRAMQASPMRRAAR